MVLTTRVMSWRTEPSRSGEPGLPWKYLLVTMLVAVCDELLGTSTPSWRKMVTPFSLPISAVRFSHSTRSKGEFLPSVKNRSKNRPLPRAEGVFPDSTSVSSDLPFNADFTVAIVPPRLRFPVLKRALILVLYHLMHPAAASSTNGVRHKRRKTRMLCQQDR